MRARLFFVALAGLAVGCEGTQPGDRCDGVFQSYCKRPLVCIATGTEKICGAKCEEGRTNPCADPKLHPRRVTDVGGLPAGCYCAP